jgi:bifunctional DNA-binding transcriptional regulator/antitoxin component of YhaV-PrlF toxin-antitoxin module
MGQEFDRKSMERLVRGLNTKSDKIRKLRGENFTRADVARFLNIRPQFVRNVEVYDQRRHMAAKVRQQPAAELGSTTKVKLGSDGVLVLPPSMREVLKLKEGDMLWVSLEDGEIRVADAHAITRRVQAMVRKVVPEGVSLVDELIAERRREAERELRDE